MSGLAFFSGAAQGANRVIEQRSKQKQAEEILKSKQKAEKARFDLLSKTADLRFQDAIRKQQQFSSFTERLSEIESQGRLDDYAINYNTMSINPESRQQISGGGFNPWQQRQIQRQEQKTQAETADIMARIENDIKTGGYYASSGDLVKFGSKDEMQSFLINEYGAAANSPEVQNLMNNVELVDDPDSVLPWKKTLKYTEPTDITIPESESTTSPVDKAILANKPTQEQGRSQTQETKYINVEVNGEVYENIPAENLEELKKKYPNLKVK